MSDKLWKAIGIDLGGFSSSELGVAYVHAPHDGKRLITTNSFMLCGDGRGEKIGRFADWCSLAIDTHVSIVVYEEPYMRNVNTLRALSNLEGVLVAMCEHVGAPYCAVHNRTLKKEMCGKGNATKEQMMAEAWKWSGKKDLTQDEADAILCAFYGLKLLEQGECLTNLLKGL